MFQLRLDRNNYMYNYNNGVVLLQMLG